LKHTKQESLHVSSSKKMINFISNFSSERGKIG